MYFTPAENCQLIHFRLHRKVFHFSFRVNSVRHAYCGPLKNSLNYLTC